MTRSFATRLALMTLPFALVLAGCAVGPDYHRPEAPVAKVYKENADWTPAAPAQIAGDQTWWSVYNDPVLDGLERQVEVSNQTLRAAVASYFAAKAVIGIDRGTLFPEIGASGGATRSHTGGGAGQGSVPLPGGGSADISSGARTRTSYNAGVNASWDIDVWGRIRRSVESDVARAQVSAADVAAARLSAQAALAEDYFELRAAEEEHRLLDTSIGDFQTSLEIARNRVKAGVATPADVYSAQTELENTQAQEVNVMLTRARLQHAIAVLVGRPPEAIGLDEGTMPAAVPVVPAGLPSDLLQRRPDISASERDVASANAEIGVAEAAWFPNLTLSGSYGFNASSLSKLISVGTSVWSFGPSLAETLFNGGARLSQNREARANYDVAVANYRQTVLTALQQVEDDLASLRYLEQQYALQQSAVADARRSETLTLNQYKAGISDYSSVITAQTTRLSSEINALSLQSQRLVSSIDLITALGGGWTTAQFDRPDNGVQRSPGLSASIK